MEKHTDNIRDQLIRKLQNSHVFWSYRKPQGIRDDMIIEKTLIHLDLDDINKLFLLFPKDKIRDIWEEKVVILGEQYRSVNLLFAYLYFDIEEPELYLEKRHMEYYEQLMHYNK